MTFQVDHVHIKSSDPDATANFYIEAMGATIVRKASPDAGWKLNLHGTNLNITAPAPHQDRKQNLGIEHIAVQTDSFDQDMKKMTDLGAKVLLVQESRLAKGMRTGFLESPDGMHQFEVLERTTLGR